jgi:hypothetical protein
MRQSSHKLDALEVVFDDPNAVANGGLVLPMTLAGRLGLKELVDAHVHLGDAPGRANVGQKAVALVASALVGGDSIHDADVLRSGRAAELLGTWVPAPSTLGTFLRSFSWADARSLDKVSGELLKRAWSAGAGPGDAPLTIDVDSSICETYGLKKQGARFGYTSVRGLHPLLASASGTGDVLGVRQREGNAHTARGAASFLAEVFGRVRAGGPTGLLSLRAGSGFYNHTGAVRYRHTLVGRSEPEVFEASLMDDGPPAPAVEAGLEDGLVLADAAHDVADRRRVGQLVAVVVAVLAQLRYRRPSGPAVPRLVQPTRWRRRCQPLPAVQHRSGPAPGKGGDLGGQGRQGRRRAGRRDGAHPHGVDAMWQVAQGAVPLEGYGPGGSGESVRAVAARAPERPSTNNAW